MHRASGDSMSFDFLSNCLIAVVTSDNFQLILRINRKLSAHTTAVSRKWRMKFFLYRPLHAAVSSSLLQSASHTSDIPYHNIPCQRMMFFKTFPHSSLMMSHHEFCLLIQAKNILINSCWLHNLIDHLLVCTMFQDYEPDYYTITYVSVQTYRKHNRAIALYISTWWHPAIEPKPNCKFCLILNH